MYGRTLLRDLMWKKQDLTTAETCCSMESSASKVTPSVFTTLENGIDASPTERQSTGTVSLLDDVYPIQPCTMSFHAKPHMIRKVPACLAVTCHLRFWQNDRDLLRATAVTQGRNRYRNKSQHGKLTLEKKILPPLLQGFKPMTFQSWVWCFDHWAISAPHCDGGRGGWGVRWITWRGYGRSLGRV